MTGLDGIRDLLGEIPGEGTGVDKESHQVML